MLQWPIFLDSTIVCLKYGFVIFSIPYYILYIILYQNRYIELKYKELHQAHLRMLATHMEQSIVLCGSTGSGKSTALHYIVHYYAQVSISTCRKLVLARAES